MHWALPIFCVVLIKDYTWEKSKSFEPTKKKKTNNPENGPLNPVFLGGFSYLQIPLPTHTPFLGYTCTLALDPPLCGSST